MGAGAGGSFVELLPRQTHQTALPASRPNPTRWPPVGVRPYDPLASSRCPPLRPSYIKTRELLLERTPSCDQIFKGVLHSLKS